MLTKRVITLGPSTDKLGREDFFRLLDLTDGVRINLAHATFDEVKARITSVRNYEAEKGRVIAVILDLKGPGVRVGKTRPIEIRAGSVVRFVYATTSDGSFIPIPLREFFRTVEPGDVLLMLDGRLKLYVLQADPDGVVARAESDGVVEQGKAVVIEGKDYDIEPPSQEDIEALHKIAEIKDEVDYISVSLARNCRDVENTRRLLRELGYSNSLMVKIETKSAVENIDEIIKCGDYLVVARGDLGLHYGLEKLPAVQRRIIRKALKAGKPVAVATQLLDSTQWSPTPTRAETNDVFTTASMSVDSLWLTNETSSGKYPLEATLWLNKILEGVEYIIDEIPEALDARDKFAKGLVEMARDIGAELLVYSMSGTLARRIAKFRPISLIKAGTPSLKVARALAVIWAIKPVYLPAGNYQEGLDKLISLQAKRPFIATYGIKNGIHTVVLTIE